MQEPWLIVSEVDAAVMVSLSVRTLQRLRVVGGGPQFVKLTARRVGYRIVDIEAWVASRVFASTSAVSIADGDAKR